MDLHHSAPLVQTGSIICEGIMLDGRVHVSLESHRTVRKGGRVECRVECEGVASEASPLKGTIKMARNHWTVMFIVTMNWNLAPEHFLV